MFDTKDLFKLEKSFSMDWFQNEVEKEISLLWFLWNNWVKMLHRIQPFAHVKSFFNLYSSLFLGERSLQKCNNDNVEQKIVFQSWEESDSCNICEVVLFDMKKVCCCESCGKKSWCCENSFWVVHSIYDCFVLFPCVVVHFYFVFIIY